MKKRFQVEGMTCAACQSHVERAAKGVKGVTSCQVNLLNNNMDVELNDEYEEGSIEKAVEDAGYHAYTGNGDSNPVIVKKNENKPLVRLITGFVFLILLMYVSMGNMMWGWPLPEAISVSGNQMGFGLIQFVLVLPILYIYRDYFIRGFRNLFKRTPNMDTLIAIGATASMLYGIFSLFMISYGYYEYGYDKNEYHMNLYFESAGMILVLVSLGKYLEGLSKKKTTKALEALMDLSPKKARVKRENKEEVIDANMVMVGDIVIVKPGDIIPVDGKIVAGDGSVNEANITGESVPVYKEKENKVYSSTLLESGYLEVLAEKVAEDTKISEIIHLVEEASNSKAPISKLADRVSAVFVPVILVIAALTYSINLVLLVNLHPEMNVYALALNFAITVVVIACPCALGLATPVAIMVSSGKGASLGLLIKNAEILENTSKIKTIVFDKTGTITEGKPVVTDCKLKEDSCYSVLYTMESRSNHPLARAIVAYVKDKGNDLGECSIEMIDGLGLQTELNEKTYRIVNSRYSDSSEIKQIALPLEEDGKTVLFLYENEEYKGFIALKDMPKTSSKEAIGKLHHLGIKTIMLTGDNEACGKAVAKNVGIDEVIAEVLPDEKGKVIKDLKEKTGGLVAMVGDGVNDAIALVEADIAISVGDASDVAIETSDIVLLHNDLNDISDVVRLSKRTLITIKLCLFWAFFYNFICVLLATGFLYYINGFKITPVYGSIAMSISSVSVVLTALSINFFKSSRTEAKKNEITFSVKGMMCEKCVMHVEEACKKTEGVTYAKASLTEKCVKIGFDKEVDNKEIIKNIKEAGYKAKEKK